MSDLWINVRFGTRYLQIKPWAIRFERGPLPRDAFDSWMEVYEFFGYVQ